MNTKTALWGCLSLLVACGHPAKETLSKVEEKGLDLSAMDTSVRPQDDFYNYLCVEYFLVNALIKVV